MMGRKQTPQPLSISSSATSNDNIEQAPLSALSLNSPKTPRSPFRFSSKLQSFGGHQPMQLPEHQQKQEFRREAHPSNNALESSSATYITTGVSDSSRAEGQQSREKLATSPGKGGFFSNYKASKSANNLPPNHSSRQIGEDKMSRDTDHPALPGKVSGTEVERNENLVDRTIVRRPVGASKPSENSQTSTSDVYGTSPGSSSSNITTSGKRNKPKPFSLLHRTKSMRSDKDGISPSDPMPIHITEPERSNTYAAGLKTAPLRPEHDRSFRDIMNSSVTRNRSADRQMPPSRNNADNVRNPQQTLSASARDNGGFLSGLKNSASKGVGIGKGLFGKVGRSQSTNEKEPVVDDEHYILKVINLPLIEQTRITRIAKRLEESRDKTEFWMPAFPWRAIDYLNYRGTETEGLYRVPGSGPQIKKWQRRFDTEYDLDLFEQQDLYDINIVGSMLKSWLRELPDEILPKPVQDRVSREAAGQEKVPQILIDELSNLKPYNYYLLFAITCHLSLLLAHSSKNKMDFRNLCICFQPCMKIDAVCFKYLVVDWAQCWKGCKTEDYWLEQEYQLFDQVPPSSGEGRSSTAVESHDERNISSSDSSQPPVNGNGAAVPEKAKSAQQDMKHSQTHGSDLSTDTESTGTATTVQGDPTTPKKDPATGNNKPLKTLSPIEPLSPMKF